MSIFRVRQHGEKTVILAPHLLDDRPAGERAGVTPSDKNPWCTSRLDLVTSGHRELHVVGKVRQVVDGLLDVEQLQTLDS